jgi:diguanylate cyclase (GGDEF)-like protein
MQENRPMGPPRGAAEAVTPGTTTPGKGAGNTLPNKAVPNKAVPGKAAHGKAAAPPPVDKAGSWRRWLRSLWRSLWRPPDPDLVDAGLRGEWLIAGIRLLIVILLAARPLDRFLTSLLEEGVQQEGPSTLFLWVAVAAMAEALVVYSAVMRSWGRGWIGFFSGIVDVSLVTLALAGFVRIGEPLGATNDLVLFPVYLLAIAATSLRYDWRICTLTGATAVFQYGTLVAYAVWLWDLDDPTSFLGREFSWPPQIGRLLLLVMTTLLATTLVVRAREQKRLSNRDRLTNLANRGFFDESILRIGALASRSGDPVSVAMMDVDHFKRFNDTYGHLAGDQALQAVARTLGRSFRTTDLIARYGGEEFAGIFPGMGTEDAHRRLEAMRTEIEMLTIPLPGAREVAKVTVSMGVAVWPQDGANLMEALKIADHRLYRAKESGRNCVVSSSR